MNTKMVGYQAFSGGAAHVIGLQEVPGVVTFAEIDNLSTTRQKVTPPAQCTGIEAWYLDPTGTSAGQLLVVVVDAASDADANSKLGVAGVRAFTPKNSAFREFRSDGSFISRVDVRMNVADTSNKIFFVFRSEP